MITGRSAPIWATAWSAMQSGQMQARPRRGSGTRASSPGGTRVRWHQQRSAPSGAPESAPQRLGRRQSGQMLGSGGVGMRLVMVGRRGEAAKKQRRTPAEGRRYRA